MGGTGGGSSGAVSYPAYIQTLHGLLLDNAGGDVPTNSIVDAINAAYGNSPFAGLTAFDPDDALAIAYTAVTDLTTQINAIDFLTSFGDAYTKADQVIVSELASLDSIAIDDARVSDDITAFDAILTEKLEQETLPAFRIGMLNINAVASSSYAIGQSYLYAAKNRDVAKYGTQLRVELLAKQDEINAKFMLQRRQIESEHKARRGELLRVSVAQMLATFLKQAELRQAVAALSVDAKRIHMVAKKEEVASQADLNEKDGEWDLAIFQYAGNLIASPSGGTSPNQKRPSQAISALSGALSGAAAGAAIGTTMGGPGYGTAIGAVVGAGAALLQ